MSEPIKRDLSSYAEPSTRARFRDDVPLTANGYTTDHPGMIIVLLDQSTSMNEPFGDGITKAQAAADAVNKIGFELASKCRNGNAWENKVFLTVIGYGTDPVHKQPTRPGGFKNIYLGEKTRLDSLCMGWAEIGTEGAPGFGDLFFSVKGPVKYIQPHGLGDTPMAEALEGAAAQIEAAFQAYPKLQMGFPPTIIHVTDGKPDDYKDGDDSPLRGRNTREAADKLLAIETAMGNALLFNVYLDSSHTEEHVFENETEVSLLRDGYAEFLFGISSPLPSFIRKKIQWDPAFKHVTEASRGLIITRKPGILVSMLRWGSFGVG